MDKLNLLKKQLLFYERSEKKNSIISNLVNRKIEN